MQVVGDVQYHALLDRARDRVDGRGVDPYDRCSQARVVTQRDAGDALDLNILGGQSRERNGDGDRQRGAGVLDRTDGCGETGRDARLGEEVVLELLRGDAAGGDDRRGRRSDDQLRQAEQARV